MFDFDGAKLIIIGIVMLIVIKPKDLPGVMRQVGQAIAQLRRMAAEFQGQFTEAMREAELHDLKKDVETMTKVDLDGLDPFDAVRGEIASTKAEIESHLNTPTSPPPEMASVDMPLPDAPAPVAIEAPPALGAQVAPPDIGHEGLGHEGLGHEGQGHDAAAAPSHVKTDAAQ